MPSRAGAPPVTPEDVQLHRHRVGGHGQSHRRTGRRRQGGPRCTAPVDCSDRRGLDPPRHRRGHRRAGGRDGRPTLARRFLPERGTPRADGRRRWSLARKDANIDLTFPFGDDVLRAATVFAGIWRGLEVQVFDCWRVRHEPTTRRDPEQWTCAILPMSRTGVEIEISRQSVLSRIKDAVVAASPTFGDELFDRAFRVETASEEDARLVDERVRSRLLEDTPKDRVAIEIEGGRMLYCCARIPMEERGALLEIAKRLSEAFPAS